MALPPIPPLNFTSGPAVSSAGERSSFGTTSGDWNVNLGGSGVALQSSTANMLLIAAVALVAVWLLKK